MATKAQAYKVMAKCGVQLDQDMAELGNFTLDAPDGFVFLANCEPSYLVDVYERENILYGGPTMPQIWQAIIDACEMGIEEGRGSE